MHVPVLDEHVNPLRQGDCGGFWQHGSFGRPQEQPPIAAHTPGEPVFNCLHREPAATQRLLEAEAESWEQQEPVVLHLLFAQHGLPSTPHGRQVEFRKSA